jgi:hypothetical protein
VRADEVDDLPDPQRRRQPGLLRRHAERAPAGRVARIAAAQRDPPRVGPPYPGDQADERALAGAVGAEQTDELAGLDPHRDVVERLHGAVSAADVARFGEDHFSSFGSSSARTAAV